MNPTSSIQQAPISHRGYAMAVQGVSAAIATVALAIIATQSLPLLGMIILGGVAGVSITAFAIASYYSLRKPARIEERPLATEEPQNGEETASEAEEPQNEESTKILSATEVNPVVTSTLIVVPEIQVVASYDDLAAARDAVDKLFDILHKTALSLISNPELRINSADSAKQQETLKQLIESCKALLYPYIDKRHVCQSKPLLRLQIMAAHNAGNVEKRDLLIREFRGECTVIADKNKRILEIMRGGILKGQIYLENFKTLIASGGYTEEQLRQAYELYDLNELRVYCTNVLTLETQEEAERVFRAQISYPTDIALLRIPEGGLPLEFDQIFGTKRAALPKGFSPDEWVAIPCEMIVKEGSGLKKMPPPVPSFTIRWVLKLLGGLIPRLHARAFVKHGFSGGPLAEENEKKVVADICTHFSNLLQPFLSPLYGSDPKFRGMLTQLVTANETAFRELGTKLLHTEDLTFKTFIAAAEGMSKQLSGT